MAAVEQQHQQQQQQNCEQDQGQQPVTQLEFQKAMQDFKNMFPEMDEDVIEVVLRSNNGAVDATIDQLLAMSTDNENERLRTELDATENDELPPSYSPSTPPPSYQQAVPHAQCSGPSLVSSTTQSPNTVITTSSALSDASQLSSTGQQAQVPQSHSTLKPFKLSENNKTEELITSDVTNEPLHHVRKWQPSLLGSLPQSFLRVDDTEHHSRQGNMESMTVFSSSLLQQRMEENEQQRGAEDPELAQYLEDERIALFLQNEEFMQELRDNKEFLSALEKTSDVSSQDEDDDPQELDAFPYTRKIAVAEGTDEDFREKLRNMGKLSRKKFTQLARLFSRRKKRTFKPILGDGTNPSQDNLLLHEDEYSELSEEESETELNKKSTLKNQVGGAGDTSKISE